MGGKRNQAHRTKGNARPSSSGRTAEKLATSGSSLPSFIGFGGFVDSAQGNDDTDLTIDADLRLALKKMTKKDVTTKLKAIQEFTWLCQRRSPEAIKALLSFWPRLFNRLSMDHDRRVREAFFQAHYEIVMRTRKNLAPYLRNIMGSWIIGQCDPYAPAASAAQSSFQIAFPHAKQCEAIAFCKSEIIALIDDNLFQQTPQTLSDPESTPVEEMEGKYIRIVSSSLLAWKMILSMMDKTDLDSLTENFTKMLNDGKFWKYARHDSPLVRSAWFNLISTICRVLPKILNEKKICPLVLGSLDETDAMVSPLVWEAAMHILVTYHNCWKHVNAKRAVLPKLWAVLEDGASGNATTIFPNLLPFLDKIPQEIMKNKIPFYKEFFLRLRKGLTLPRVQSSPSEINAVVKTYLECLKYIASKLDENVDDIKMEFLITEQLIIILQLSILEERSVLNTSVLYELFTDLLQHWHKNRNQIETYFFRQFELMCLEILEEKEIKQFVLSRLTEMFECLLGKMKTKPQVQRVQFVTEGATQRIEEASQGSRTPLQAQVPNFLSDEQHPFYHTLCIVCYSALRIIEETLSMAHFKFFASLIYCRPHPYVLSYLIENDYPIEDCKIGRVFFTVVVLPWLSVNGVNDQKDFPETFTTLALAAYSFSDEMSKCKILDTLCRTKNPPIIECVLRRADDNRDDVGFKKWLRSDSLETVFQELTSRLCSASSENVCQDADVIWRILTLSLTTDETNEPLVSSSCLGEILYIFQKALSKDPFHLEESMQFVCNLACKLFESYKECWSIKSTTELLLTMFAISCQPPRNLSGKVLCQVESTWKAGIRNLVLKKRGIKTDDVLFHRASEIVQKELVSENLTCKSLHVLAETTWKLLNCLHECIKLNEADGDKKTSHMNIEEIFNIFVPSTSKWESITQNLGTEWMIKATFEDALVFPNSKLPDEIPQGVESTSFVHMASFVAQLIIKMLTSEEEKKQSLKIIPLKLSSHLEEILRAIVYCEMTEGLEKRKNIQEIISNFLTDVFPNLLPIFDQMTEKEVEVIMNDIAELSNTEGFLWSLCLQKMLAFVPSAKKLISFIWSYYKIPPLGDEVQCLFHSALVTQERCSCDWRNNPLTNLSGSSDEIAISKLIEYIAISRKQLQICDENDPYAATFVKKILELFAIWQDKKSNFFLFACDIQCHDWPTIVLNVEMFKLISVIVTKFYEPLESKHWDFVLCALCSWSRSCYDSKDSICTNLRVLYYVNECYNFMKAMTDLITRIEGGLLLPNHPDLLMEWQEFFSEGVFPLLLQLLVSISDVKAHAKLADVEYKLILSLTTALESIPLKCLENNILPQINTDDTEDPQIPINLKTLLAHLSPLLLASVRPIKIFAYRLLKKVVPLIATCNDSQEIVENTEAPTEENPKQPPVIMKNLLTELTAIVNAYFAEEGTVETKLQPESSVLSDMMSYLLAWDLVMDLLGAVSSALRSEYSGYLESSGLMPDLMANLFNIIPENASVPNQGAADGTAPKTMFSEEPALLLHDTISYTEVQHVACKVYFEAVKKLPALLRQWWNNQNKQTLSLVERITTKYVSTILIAQELQAVQKSEKTFGNMTVKARIKTQEVLAVYAIDEVSMELTIKLAPNHPLGRVTVECVRRIGVGHTQWRNWMLQLNTFLMYQNGSILDGLTLWKRNIDKKFEGIEECYICFYVLHTNYQLPRLVCRTCKKKFHSACLYKWFSTSNQSTCPLCRNLF